MSSAGAAPTGGPNAAGGQPLDAAAFRDIMGGFTTGVAVVTVAADDGLHGMTVNSLTAVSLDPLLLLVCLTRDSRTSAAVAQAGRFAVNLLGIEQRELSNTFARRGVDHFAGLDVTWTDQTPTISGGLGHLICSVSRIDDGGDHHIVVAEVTAGEKRPAEPLVFYRGRYGRYVPLARTQRDIGIDWFG